MGGVTARRGSTFYSGLTLGIITAALGITFITFFFDSTFDNDNRKDLSLLFGVVLIVLGYYFISVCLKNSRKITIDNKYLTINRKALLIQDIKHINFTGKYRFTVLDRKEGVEIIFNNGDTCYIFDDFYSNSAELKYFLENAWLGKPQIPKNESIYYTTGNDYFFYKGSIINFNLLLLATFTGFVTYIVLISPNKNRIGFMFLIPIALACIFLNRFYYFGIGNGVLVVKSFTYFWIKKAYPLNEIREILFETNGKAPHSMTITMQDYTKKKYYASSLYNKHWRALKHDLESKGITVRDEIRLG